MFDFKQEEQEFVRNYITSNISNITKIGNKWNIRCSICGDSKKSTKKKRGWYYLDTNSYHCFNEGCSASGLYIISKLFNINIEDVRKDFVSTLKNINTSYSIPLIIPEPVKEIINTPQFQIPNHWIDLPEEAINYIKQRKILEAPYLPSTNYKFYYNSRNKRLVIPWYKDNSIIYYQERSLDNSTPKYLFPSNLDKEITGINNLNYDYEYLYMVEGLLDSIFIYNSVTLGGLTPTSRQLNTLDKLPFKLVNFFDNQWTDEASMKVTLKIAKNEPNKKVFIWPKFIKEKDVNEYIINNSINIFKDPVFLSSRIMSGLRIILEFKT